MKKELLEKLKAMKTDEELVALVKEVTKEKVSLSAADLDGVAGGLELQHMDEATKEMTIWCAENGMEERAVQILRLYGIEDYSLIRQEKIAELGTDARVIRYIVETFF